MPNDESTTITPPTPSQALQKRELQLRNLL